MIGQPDHKFMKEAAQGGLMEVKLAQMAQEKASSEDVKQYAKQLETDHSKANQELQKLAAAKQVTLPTDMGEKHQKHVAKLENLSGAEFDKAYMKMMVKDHKHDVKMFERQAERSMDSDVKAFAAKTVPVLQEHLQTAQNLENTTKNASRQDGTRARSADKSSGADQSTGTDRTSDADNSGTTAPNTRDQSNPTPRP